MSSLIRYTVVCQCLLLFAVIAADTFGPIRLSLMSLHSLARAETAPAVGDRLAAQFLPPQL